MVVATIQESQKIRHFLQSLFSRFQRKECRNLRLALVIKRLYGVVDGVWKQTIYHKPNRLAKTRRNIKQPTQSH